MASEVAEVELDLPSPVIPIPTPIPCNLPEISLEFLGGFKLFPILSVDFPLTRCNQIASLLEQLMALLGMINPMFLVSDVLLAVLECFQAVPEAISSLSPEPLFDCLERLLCAVFSVTCTMFPPFAFPAMIVSIVNFIIEALRCVQENLIALCEFQNRLSNLIGLLEAAGPDLQDIMETAQFNAQCRQTQALNLFETINLILEVVNTFIAIANALNPNTAPDAPPLMPVIVIPSLPEDPVCEQIVETIDSLISVLEVFTGTILPCELCE